jgi:phospholipase C
MKRKVRHSLAAFTKSGIAVTTLAAFLSTSAGPLLAGPPDDRKHSEEAVKHLKHIIVIYQENWSFDSLYGQFPGASGYALGFDTLSQYDVHASPA